MQPLHHELDRRRFLNLAVVAGAGGLVAGIGRQLSGGEAAPQSAADAKPQGACELLVGAATISITPDKPVALASARRRAVRAAAGRAGETVSHGVARGPLGRRGDCDQ